MTVSNAGQIRGFDTDAVEQCPTEDAVHTSEHAHTDYHHPEDTDIICERCGQSGHTDLQCRVRLDHSKRIFRDFIPFGKRKAKSHRVSTLVGSSNETNVAVEGKPTRALLDSLYHQSGLL